MLEPISMLAELNRKESFSARIIDHVVVRNVFESDYLASVSVPLIILQIIIGRNHGLLV